MIDSPVHGDESSGTMKGDEFLITSATSSLSRNIALHGVCNKSLAFLFLLFGSTLCTLIFAKYDDICRRNFVSPQAEFCRRTLLKR